jgi:DNA-binding transcriptional ArsR family regulator
VPNQLPSLDKVFHALADPTRRGMVERLVRGPASVSELSRPLEMSLPAVLQHLQVLEASGLVRSEKAGRVRTCRIEPDALRAAEAWVTGQRTAWETRLDRLGDYLAGQGTDGQGTDGQNTDDSQRGN